MNSVSKFVLFTAIAGFGLYCCGMILVEKPPQSTQQDDWDSLTNHSQKPGESELSRASNINSAQRIDTADNTFTSGLNVDLELPTDEVAHAASQLWQSERSAPLNAPDQDFDQSVARLPNEQSDIGDEWQLELDDQSMESDQDIGSSDELAVTDLTPQPGAMVVKSLPMVSDDGQVDQYQDQYQNEYPGETSIESGEPFGSESAKVSNPFFASNKSAAPESGNSFQTPHADNTTIQNNEQQALSSDQQVVNSNQFYPSNEADVDQQGSPPATEPTPIPMMESIQQAQQNQTVELAELPDSAFEPPMPVIESEPTYADPAALADSSHQIQQSVQSIRQDSQSVQEPTVAAVPNVDTFQQSPPQQFRPATTSPQVSGNVQSQAVNADLPIMRASQVVEVRAQQHIEYGKSLARRGAIFAARQEFIQSLRLIADSHDMNSGTRAYTAKLAAGLQALAESDDFVAVDSEQQLQMNVRSIVESHSTQVIPRHIATETSPIQAMKGYYSFAARQISQGVGESRVASEALQSLGKLLTTAARFDVSGKPMDRTKAMVMHQVAMSANAANYQSANELGVLLAKNGSWHQAAELFGESLKQKHTATTWKNLAMAHSQIARMTQDQNVRSDQIELANLAILEAQRMGSGNEMMAAMVPSDWTSTSDFNASAAMPQNAMQAFAGQSDETPGNYVETATKPPRKSLLKKMKDMF